MEIFKNGDYTDADKQLKKYCQDVRAPYGVLLAENFCAIYRNKYYSYDQEPKRVEKEEIPTISQIENMWPERHKIYEQFQRLGFDLVTSINYSVWFCQTHSEHLINVKRNWLTFHEMQKFGLPAIPNIYWYGRKDLARWVEWLNNNPQVKTASINLQTLRTPDSWNTVTDLEFLAEHLDHKIQFLVDGPTTPERIELIKKILPSVSFTNKFCFSTAASGFTVNQDKKSLIKHHSLIPKPHIFRQNSEFYKNLNSNLISKKSSFDIFGSSFEV
ncbi:MAG TPA: hypothetical protein VF837_05270 [Patescibacteria group bacterium]